MNALAWALVIYFAVTRVPIILSLFFVSAATLFGPEPKYPLPILFVQWFFGMLPAIIFWTCPIWADFFLYPTIIARAGRMLYYKVKYGNLSKYYEDELERVMKDLED